VDGLLLSKQQRQSTEGTAICCNFKFVDRTIQHTAYRMAFMLKRTVKGVNFAQYLRYNWYTFITGFTNYCHYHCELLLQHSQCLAVQLYYVLHVIYCRFEQIKWRWRPAVDVLQTRLSLCSLRVFTHDEAALLAAF